MPSGRGAGSLADDLYALGVLIAVLLSGGNPCAEMSDEEIVQSKINRGSFATLLSSRRFSLPCTEALRGLLCDEAEERWSVSNLEFWANGRHLSPKQPLLPGKAPRPFVVKGRDYWNLKALGATGRRRARFWWGPSCLSGCIAVLRRKSMRSASARPWGLGQE